MCPDARDWYTEQAFLYKSFQSFTEHEASPASGIAVGYAPHPRAAGGALEGCGFCVRSVL